MRTNKTTSSTRSAATFFSVFLTASFALSTTSFGNNQIEDSIKRQEVLTRSKILKNGVSFTERDIPGSEIVHFEINIQDGQYSLPESNRALNSLTFDVLPLGSKKFSKEKIFSIAEKHSIGIQCSGGIEQSSCQFETVQENFDKALEIFSSILSEPVFEDQDIGLMRDRRAANYQQDLQNPEAYVNALVNKIFYPKGHPYRHLPNDGIEQLKSFKKADLTNYYNGLIKNSASPVGAIFVGPTLSAQQKNRLESLLSIFSNRKPSSIQVPEPQFDAKENFLFEHRPIPTAYIRAKFNVPGIKDKNAAAAKVLFEILSEELHEEIRTKRSLSYAISAATLQFTQGIGVLHASTSKPQDTIQAMSQVLKKVMDQKYSPDKLAEYKNVFTTSYYMALETHDNFAGSLASSVMYFNDPNHLYSFPKRIAAVTSEEIQSLAKATFKNLRVAVVYDESKFQPKWVEPLTNFGR
ncbi:MAG: insulinase family protein [Proteobacteria bacterium]|nr:insulinase family protein [Pseudomonadota bacterium]